MTEIGKRLFTHFPPKINQDGEIISSLVANEEGTGALEKLFEYSELVKNKYSKASDVYAMDGDLIDQVMDVFSFFERFYQETDGSFVKRNKSIFVRGGDVTFGTTWNVKHVFEYYFPRAKIFLIDNIGRWTDNILINSDFESIVQSEIDKWSFSNCELRKEAAFAGERGVYFLNNSSTLSQTATVEKNAIYFVTCAVDGNVEISVVGSAGDTKHIYSIGEVVNGTTGTGRSVNTENWKFIQYFFYADKNENVTVKVKGTTGAKVDLVTLDKKRSHSSFMVYVWFDQVIVGGKTLHLSKTGNDPVPGIDYSKESYFDNTFLMNTAGNSLAVNIYKDILEMVKPAGTKADIMLITKQID